MKTISLALALFGFVTVIPATGQPDDPKFDTVVLVEGKGRNISLLYVVLTQPNADHDKLNELVARYAKAAIQVASKYEFGATKADEKPKHRGNVVFLVRSSRNAREGYVTGFGLDQLREIAAASPEQGKRLVSRHAWTLGKLTAGKK